MTKRDACIFGVVMLIILNCFFIYKLSWAEGKIRAHAELILRMLNIQETTIKIIERMNERIGRIVTATIIPTKPYKYD